MAEDEDDGQGLPTEFDPRNYEPWSYCSDLLNLIRDQSRCGSCWAFSSTSSFNDRRCIATGNTETLSPADAMACCYNCGYGCDGGWPSAADKYFVTTGAVTGGLYGSDDGCYPYPFSPNMAGFRQTLRKFGDEPADLGDDSTPMCPYSCPVEGFDWEESKRKASRAAVYRGRNEVKRTMVEKGPVSATMTVYKDFMLYKGGVYQKTSSEALGGHAIKCLGYGSEDGVDYALCANSWNVQWGEDGFFRIDWNDLDHIFSAVEIE